MRRGLRLLPHGRHDFADPRAALSRGFGDLLERLPRLGGEIDTAHHTRRSGFDRPDRVLALFLNRANQAADLLGARQHAIRQFLDLVRHDREGPAVLARLRRDDRRVERQQIRFVRDVVDHVEDAADLLGPVAESANHALRRIRRFANLFHADDGLHDLRLSQFRLVDDRARKLGRGFCRGVHGTHRARHLFHARRRLFRSGRQALRRRARLP